MSSIPSNLSRVPNMLASRIALANISRTNVDILRVSEQISTRRSILRPSDDIVKAASIGVLDDRLDRSNQVLSNLSHASASLDLLDSTLASITTFARSAKDIASNQVGSTATASERDTQATNVDSLIQSIFGLVNTSGVAGHIFGGSTPSRAPVTAFGSGYRYSGQGSGLMTDLGNFGSAPITIGASPVAGVASRVKGSVDLNPALTGATSLSTLGGARGLGVSTGTINISIDGGAVIPVDLTGSVTAQDITTRIQSAITQYETANTVTILGPGGVGTTGGAFSLAVAGVHTVEFSDIGSSTIAKDLGLASTTPLVFSSSNALGVDTNPKLTLASPVSALTGVTGALGSIRISNAGRTSTVDLSTAATIQDVKNLIEGTDMGVRVQINQAGTGIDVLNDVSAGSSNALAISEVTGNNLTASRLGIRSFDTTTRVSDLNFGRGVSVIDGVNNPITGVYDPALNTDIRITLGDASHTEITIDLRPAHMTDIQSVLNAINTQASAALVSAGLSPTDFTATLTDGGNGIAFVQNTAFPDLLEVKPLNNSQAAAQLGLLNGTYDIAAATWLGDDRAKARVDDMFTRLIDLRDALRGNNTTGITVAGEDLESTTNSLVETMGLVGGYARRVDDATVNETNRNTLDEVTRDNLRDLDFAAASSRFTLLQTQLQAGLQIASLSQSRTLLDFLG